MKMILFLAVLLAASEIHGYARLGETMDQCVARYGAAMPMKDPKAIPGGMGDSYAVFQKNGFVISVVIFRGVVGAEVIVKVDSSEFTDNEKQNFLDADSATLTWTKPDTLEVGADVWIRDDGAVARYDMLAHSLSLESKAFCEAGQAKRAADENAKMKDF